MTYSLEDLRQRALEMQKELPAHVSVMCLNGATVGFREVLEELLFSVHEILDILVRTYSAMETPDFEMPALETVVEKMEPPANLRDY